MNAELIFGNSILMQGLRIDFENNNNQALRPNDGVTPLQPLPYETASFANAAS